MKKKLTIIGGGITGCALALYASKKNYEVKIYEKNGFLGGILRDALIDNHLFFKHHHSRLQNFGIFDIITIIYALCTTSVHLVGN